MDKDVKLALGHAKRFGVEQVMETAIEVGYSFRQLVQLREGLDQIEEEWAKRGRRFSNWKKPRKSAESRMKQLLGIEEEEAA